MNITGCKGEGDSSSPSKRSLQTYRPVCVIQSRPPGVQITCSVCGLTSHDSWEAEDGSAGLAEDYFGEI